MTQSARRAVFLDRDGTINMDHGYVFRTEDFDLIPGSVDAIRRLRDAGFLVIVVTNQAGVARGLYREADVHHLHRHLDRLLGEAGTAIDAYYYCPHHPDKGIGPYRRDCSCRKPLPGMIHQAAADFGVNLASSWLVGDKTSDIAAALAAGCRPILVATGYGAGVEALPQGVARVSDLAEAATLIIDTNPAGSQTVMDVEESA